jgi:hypothetical protein
LSTDVIKTFTRSFFIPIFGLSSTCDLDERLCVPQVDLGYVREAAKLAREAGVPHFSIMTAGGANSKAWAGNSVLFHGLLYMKTKGQAEDFVKAQVCKACDGSTAPPMNVTLFQVAVDRELTVTMLTVEDNRSCSVLYFCCVVVRACRRQP